MSASQIQFKLKLSIVATLSVALLIISFYPNLIVQNIGRNIILHSAFEAFGAFAALLFGLLIYNYKTKKQTTSFYWLSISLFAMGIFDLFHSLSAEGNNFVRFHSASILLGGLFSSFIIVKSKYLTPKFRKNLLLGFSIFITTLCIFFLRYPSLGITMISNDNFTIYAKLFNLSGGVLFFISAIYMFKEYHKSNITDYYYIGIFLILMSLSGITFLQDDIWTDNWWLWHEIRVVSYVLGVILFINNYNHLNLSLNRKNQELETSNRELITAKNKAEESEKHINSIIENTEAGYFFIDNDGNFQNVNKAWLDLYKYNTLEDVIGVHFTKVQQIEDVESAKEHVEGIKDGKTEFMSGEFSRLCKDGTIGYHNFSATPAKLNDVVVGIEGFIIDTTKQKEIENNLRVIEEKNRVLTDTIPGIVYECDKDWTFLYASSGFEELTGFPTSDIINNKVRAYVDLMLEDDTDRITIVLDEAIKRKDQLFFSEYKLKTKNGKIKWVHDSVRISYDKKSNAIGYSGVILDITSRKEGEIELVKAKEKAEESDRLKSAFLANMSHEIRTPMNAILGFSGLLKKANLSEEKKEKYLEFIELGGKRLLSLISDIVDVSKIDANQLPINYEACNVNALIDNLQEQFKIHDANKGCDIKTNKGLADTKSIISTDNTRLFQILANLIGNSLKFTKKGHVEFGYIKKGEMLEFFVKDTGIGIDEKNHAVIFDRFKQVDNDYSRSGSGTGLGLSIVKSLTKLLGGKVWVESEKNKGATFNFTIPYNITENKKEETHKIDINLDSNKEITILIAEDEYSNYIYLEALFEDFKYNIIHARNGKEAIEMAENYDSIDLILMDIKMPVLNGLEATKEIRKTNMHIPIISLTAYAMAEDKQKALKAGCNDYLTKPLSENNLSEIMNKYLKKGSNKKTK